MNRLLFIFLFCFSFTGFSQEIVIPSFSFEHPTHVDAFVNVIRCELDNTDYVSITVFNESGKPVSVGLEVIVSDKSDKLQQIIVPVFNVNLWESISSSCKGENDSLGLRVPLDTNLDKNSINIEVNFKGL